VVAGARQHIVAYELGAAGRNAGIQFDPVDDSDGTIRAADVVRARQAADYHQPTTSLVCVENTHMPAGGVPWSLSALRDVREAAGTCPCTWMAPACSMPRSRPASVLPSSR